MSSSIARRTLFIGCAIILGTQVVQAEEAFTPHPMLPDQLRIGLKITEAIEIVVGEGWQPEARGLSPLVPVRDKRISAWFGDRKIAFNTCKEISDVTRAEGAGLAHCQMNYRRGDRRLQLTTLHRFQGADARETPVITMAKIESYSPFLLNNPPGSPVAWALGYLKAEGWTPDPHLYEGLISETSESETLKAWYSGKRLSNVECWNESYSGLGSTDTPGAIDAYGVSHVPSYELPTCWLSFVKLNKRVVLKATSGKQPASEPGLGGPTVLDWSDPGDIPLELIKIQPGMQLTKVLRFLGRRLSNGRYWGSAVSRADFQARTPASERARYRWYTERNVYNIQCMDSAVCTLSFIDKKENGHITNLEIKVLNKTTLGQEPTIVRAVVWYGGGT